MKTREIDVWVSKDFQKYILEHKSGYYKENLGIGNVNTARDSVKAKLIIELPEQKIEITESEFNRVTKLYAAQNLDVKTYSGLVETLKKQLGFK